MLNDACTDGRAGHAFPRVIIDGRFSHRQHAFASFALHGRGNRRWRWSDPILVPLGQHCAFTNSRACACLVEVGLGNSRDLGCLFDQASCALGNCDKQARLWQSFLLNYRSMFFVYCCGNNSLSLAQLYALLVDHGTANLADCNAAVGMEALPNIQILDFRARERCNHTKRG